MSLVVVIVSGLAGCRASSPDEGHAKVALEELSKAFSCPASSITVTARPDLNSYDLHVTPRTPPADVAADPARLAEWKRRDEKNRQGYERMSVQYASGCGHAVYYTCSMGTTSNQEQIVSCSAARNPPK